jgi:hypothetical protein
MGAAGVAGESGGGVPEAVAQRRWFGMGEVAGQQQCLASGEQVLGELDEQQPDLVV